MTRVGANQIAGATVEAYRGTRITVEQAARLDPQQLAGNVRVLRFQMTDADTGAVSEALAVAIYPPAEWCTPSEPRICP